MKPALVFIGGAVLGAVIAGGAVWAWATRSVGSQLDVVLQACDSDIRLLGHEAATALTSPSPHALQDFANHVVDSAIHREPVGVSAQTVTAPLAGRIIAIPADRRALSGDAPQRYLAMRKLVADQAPD